MKEKEEEKSTTTKNACAQSAFDAVQMMHDYLASKPLINGQT